MAHSPDSDDAFMFYALARNKIETPGLQFVHELKDIETLNRHAMNGVYDVSAISFHAYAYLADTYALMPCGASIGNGYGPVLVARGKVDEKNLRNEEVAIPGTMTTAYLALKLYESDFRPRFMPFDRILDAVMNGEVVAGLLIHEGQLTYGKMGLMKVLDLGEWWYEKYKLPLPLGANVIRKGLGKDLIRRVCHLMRASIRYSLTHREEAMAYALEYARGLDYQSVDRFVGMYVNDQTLGYDKETRTAVTLLLEEGSRRGIIPRRVIPEFIEF